MKKLITSIYILILILFSSIILSPLTVHASYVIDTKITGKEDATNPDDFNGNVTIMDEYKIWSFCKSYGLSDEQVLGILGCFACESNFHPETVEGKYSFGTTIDDMEQYIENYSEPFITEHDSLTVDAVMLYNNSPYGPVCDGCISAARKGGSHCSNGLNEAAYFVDGVGYCGIGIAQFTGGRCKILLEWAEENKCDWYNMENQLIWSITAIEDKGDTRSPCWEQYKNETAGMSVNECTKWWALHYENGNMGDGDISKRQTAANAFIPMFSGKSWDSTYGDSIVSGAGLQPSRAKNGINDKSIIYSFFSNVLRYPQNVGFFLNPNANDEMNKKNQDVYKGYVSSLQGKKDKSKKYSLYELFGEDLHWYRYFGEATYAPQLPDHIWSATVQHRTSQLVSPETIDYEATNYLSCHVYPDRPDVLTKEDLDNGYNDPRVLSLSKGFFNGFSYVEGSFCLTASKLILSVMSLLMGHEIMDLFVEIITAIETSETFEIIRAPILFIVAFAMIAFIISLVGKGIKYAKGQGAAADAISRFFIGFICLGMIFSALYRPDIFNDIILKSLTIVDQFFEATLAKSVEGDEVIDVEDDDMVVKAALWKTCIFNAWCRGQFDNLEYKDLYTNYAVLEKGQKAMPQSNDTIDTNDNTGKAFYDSTSLTGDVCVPIGGNTVIRNWAAYLYSCGSKYHIDYTLDVKSAETLDPKEDASFPIATTTAYNSKLFADTFRVIDAQMDISPQYYADGTKSVNYAKAHLLKPHYMSQGVIMIINAALLFLLLPPIFKKITSFILLIITTLKMIYFTILELFKQDSGFNDFLKSFKKNIVDYIVSSIKINIMVVLYMMFVDKGVFMSIIYILLCLTVLSFNVKDAKKIISNVKHNINTMKNFI